jgi:putative flippase GtrA
MQANGASLSATARPSASQIFLRYVLFAVLAGVANLLAQAATAKALPMLPLMAAILVGTIVGFVVKYVLDKKWIFQDAFTRDLAEAQKVAKYGIFSVATTFVFWGTELAFWHIWQTDLAKYSGAVLGLAVGNWIKYLLDRRYTFRRIAP